jgi:hypothetical protein
MGVHVQISEIQIQVQDQQTVAATVDRFSDSGRWQVSLPRFGERREADAVGEFVGAVGKGGVTWTTRRPEFCHGN